MRRFFATLDAVVCAIGRWLIQPPGTRIAVVALLSIHAGMLAYSASRHSPTMLEPAFLASGLSHWNTGRFDAFSVNPPLPRLIASIPVIAVGYNMDWRELANSVSRPEFGLGVDFVTANRERTGILVSLARLTYIPISLGGAWCCYCWSRRLWGCSEAGLLSLAIWVFEPILAGHAALLTADGPSASFTVIAGYVFWTWLTEKPSFLLSLLAGASLGAAFATKFTLLLLGVGWLISLVVASWAFRFDFRRRIGECILLLAATLVFVNATYAFSGTWRRLADLPLQSRALQSLTQSPHWILHSATRRIPLPVPAAFVLGVDLQCSDIETRTAPSFAHGQWSQSGWWYFYIYALLVKCSPGLLLLLLLATATPGPSEHSSIQGELILLVSASLILLVLSSHTSLNRHLRYALPLVSLSCVFVGRCFSGDRLSRSRSYWSVVAAGLTIWSSVSAFPSGLAYFNGAATLVRPADWHLIDSNLDWGQDLYRLAEWRQTIPPSEPVFAAHFHRIDPRVFGIDVEPLILPDQFSSASQLRSGYYVISASLLRGMPWYSLERSDGTVDRYRLGALRPFLEIEPVTLVGQSLKVFYVPRKLGGI